MNYNQYVKNIRHKYNINDKSFKLHNKINNLFNIICFLFLTFFAFKNNFSFLKYIFFIIFGFIFFDVFCIIIEKIILINKNIINNIKHSIKISKFKRMKKEDQLKIIKDKEKEKNEYIKNNKRHEFYEEDLNKINQEIDFYKENINEIKENDQIIQEAFSKRYLNDVEYIKNIISMLKEEKINYSKNIEKKFDKIISISEDLINICKNEPILVGQLMTTFNVHLVELINTLKIYNKLSKEEKQENQEKVDLIFDELIKHLKELREKIQFDSSEKFKINADLLLDVLKKKENK